MIKFSFLKPKKYTLRVSVGLGHVLLLARSDDPILEKTPLLQFIEPNMAKDKVNCYRLFYFTINFLIQIR